MAGVKGKSGGARANSGGVRVGAGRKPSPSPKPVPVDACDMLELLQQVALGRVDATAIQVKAAIAAVQYTHAKKSELGKKEEKQDAAIKASSGRFVSSPPPRLVKVA